MEGRTILLAGLPAALETELRLKLPDAQFTALTNLAASREQLGQLRAGVAVVAISDTSEALFRLVNTLSLAGTRVVAVGPTKDADLILRAMRGGAHEYVLVGDVDKLVRAIRDQGRPARATGLGSVVAIFPARGGAGATSIAVNLGGSVARLGERVCVVDLDLTMGDALSFLDLQGGYAISDVISNLGRLDRELLDASVVRHASGVHVLSQVERMEGTAGVDVTGITSLLEFLRQHFRLVIVDGLHTFDDHAVAALDASDHVLLVVTQEVPAVRRAQRCASFLRRLGHGERVRLLVNRYAKSAEVNTALLTETVALPVAATLSSDYPALVRCINRGALLADEAPRSILTREIDALHPLIGYGRDERRGKRGLLKRLFAPKAVPDGT